MVLNGYFITWQRFFQCKNLAHNQVEIAAIKLAQSKLPTQLCRKRATWILWVLKRFPKWHYILRVTFKQAVFMPPQKLTNQKLSFVLKPWLGRGQQCFAFSNRMSSRPLKGLRWRDINRNKGKYPVWNNMKIDLSLIGWGWVKWDWVNFISFDPTRKPIGFGYVWLIWFLMVAIV